MDLADLASLGRTPWVDRAFRQFWDRVAAAAPKPEWVPRVADEPRLSVVEFGCGVYGCAIPTTDPGVLVKITSDPSEAAFAVTAMSFGEWPEGIVKYYAAFTIPNVTFRRRPVAILWRDEATDVGRIVPSHPVGIPAIYQLQRALAGSLHAYRTLAGDLRKRLLNSADPWALLAQAKELEQWAYERYEETLDAGRVGQLQGAQRVAASLQILTLIEQEMMSTDMQDSLGEALNFYHERNLVLADVHLNNIGRRDRQIVITDPGHAVPLTRERSAVAIPSLP